MYVPFRKIYRAFTELDDVSDDECDRYVRRARLKMGRSGYFAPWVAAVAAGTTGGVIAIRGASRWFGGTTFDLFGAIGTTIIVAISATVLAAGIAGLLVRDLVLLRAVRTEVHRARCRKCRQSLHGLRVRTVGTHPGPTDSFVRCPECGKEWCLFDLGLRAEDLIPWEQRAVPPDFAKKRRRGPWDLPRGRARW